MCSHVVSRESGIHSFSFNTSDTDASRVLWCSSILKFSADKFKAHGNVLVCCLSAGWLCTCLHSSQTLIQTLTWERLTSHRQTDRKQDCCTANCLIGYKLCLLKKIACVAQEIFSIYHVFFQPSAAPVSLIICLLSWFRVWSFVVRCRSKHFFLSSGHSRW